MDSVGYERIRVSPASARDFFSEFESELDGFEFIFPHQAAALEGDNVGEAGLPTRKGTRPEPRGVSFSNGPVERVTRNSPSAVSGSVRAPAEPRLSRFAGQVIRWHAAIGQEIVAYQRLTSR